MPTGRQQEQLSFLMSSIRGIHPAGSCARLGAGQIRNIR
jgi:hypothetical protein